MNNRSNIPAKKRTLSTPVLISVYVAAAVIIALCAWQFSLSPAQNWFYAVLAVLAVGYVVFISVTNSKNKNPGSNK